MTTNPRLSLVLPCFNGRSYVAESLRSLFSWLEEHRNSVGTTEVFLVDDGSTDDTAAVATATGLPFRLVRHPSNRGKGAAVRSGMSQASGEYRIFMDADMPFDFGVIEQVLRYLDFKEFDICIGSRAARDRAYSIARPTSRRFASVVFTEFVGRLVVTGVRDTQCGLKGFRAAAADYLFGESRVDGFAFDVELLYLAFKAGFDVKTLPVQILAEKPSTLSVVRAGLPMLFEVMKLPIRWHRGGYRPYATGERP